MRTMDQVWRAAIGVRDDTAAAVTRGQVPHPRADGDIGQAMTTLYQTHYRSLVRLAALLVSDLAVAEDIVQDSFHPSGARHVAGPARHRCCTGLPAPVGGPSFPVGSR